MQNGKLMYGYAECKSCMQSHSFGSDLKTNFQANVHNTVWHVKMMQPM